MPNQFSPIYQAQPLKPRELRRVKRNALPSVDRAALWPVDRAAIERQLRARIMRLDFALDALAFGMMLCVGVMGAAVVFSQSYLADAAIVCFWSSLVMCVVIVSAALWVWGSSRAAHDRLEAERKIAERYSAAAEMYRGMAADG